MKHQYYRVEQIKDILQSKQNNDVDQAVKSIIKWVPSADKKELAQAAEQVKKELSKPV